MANISEKSVEAKRPKPIIEIDVWTERFLGTMQKAESFLPLIEQIDHERWRPEKWNNFEPVKNIYNENAKATILNEWTEQRRGFISNSMMFKRSKPKLLMWVNSWRGRVPGLNNIHLDLDANAFAAADGPLRLKSIVQELVTWSEAAYATARHSEQMHDRYAQYTPEKRLERLDWLSFFGPKYVSLFGLERVVTAPFYSSEVFADGLILLATETPNDPLLTQSTDLLEKLELSLGVDVFASDFYLQIPCRVPTFDLSETTNAAITEASDA